MINRNGNCCGTMTRAPNVSQTVFVYMCVCLSLYEREKKKESLYPQRCKSFAYIFHCRWFTSQWHLIITCWNYITEIWIRVNFNTVCVTDHPRKYQILVRLFKTLYDSSRVTNNNNNKRIQTHSQLWQSGSMERIAHLFDENMIKLKSVVVYRSRFSLHHYALCVWVYEFIEKCKLVNSDDNPNNGNAITVIYI